MKALIRFRKTDALAVTGKQLIYWYYVNFKILFKKAPSFSNCLVWDVWVNARDF